MNFLEADVAIKVDDSKLPAQLTKARSAVTRTVDKIKASFKKMGASFKAAFDKMVRIAKYAAVGIAAALTLAVRAAMKQEDAVNRLNITLKATGHAAGLTSKQLTQHAAALQQVTRFGDETIIAMQTMLLTFKNIKGDEFKRATEAALDMAAAEANVSGGAVDLTATSIRLGKALNDPILGITALSRVGVQFTEVQKDMIKALAEGGDIAGAQKIIFKELESQFGGTARDVNTASGALKQMWNALGDVAEKIGAAFIPGIKDSAKAVKKWAEDNQERIGEWAKEAVAYITYVKDVLVSFIVFLETDWKAGFEYAKNVGIAIMKDMSTAILKVIDEMMNKIYEKFTAPSMWRTLLNLIKRNIEQSPMGILIKKISPLEPKEITKRPSALSQVGIPPELLSGFNEAAEKLKTNLAEAKQQYDYMTTFPPVMKFDVERGAAAEPAAPPAAAEQVEETVKSYQRLMKELDFELTLLGKISEERERAISMAQFDVELIKEFGVEKERSLEQQTAYNELMDEYVGKLDEIAEGQRGWGAYTTQLKQWGSEACNTGKRLGEITVKALDGTADALTDMCLTGKADFKALAQSILADITRMIIKQMMFNALVGGGVGSGGGILGLLGGLGSALFGGGGGGMATVGSGTPQAGATYAKYQEGGIVPKTGFAMLHKGEEVIPAYARNGNGNGDRGNVTINVGNVPEDYTVSEADEYMFGDERIINVVMEKIQTNGPFRRAIKTLR